MLTQGDWHGLEGVGTFTTSQQAYDTLHIGNPKQARRMQAGKSKSKSKRASKGKNAGKKKLKGTNKAKRKGKSG